MIHLAYDGSLNGDWVSRYAIRLAAHPDEGRLAVVHVPDGASGPEALAEKLARIEREARAQGVAVERVMGAPSRDVLRALRDLLPRGPEHLVVCGTRVRSRRGFLAGTVSQALLAHPELRVVAVRVVQPGLLGNPRSFLIPLADPRRAIASAWPFFARFLRGVERVSLLRVMPVGALRYRHLTARRSRELREAGAGEIGEAIAELEPRLAGESCHLDGRAIVSDDWPHEIVVHANQLHARMILMGASDRTLYRRGRGAPLERVLRGAPCDVGICRGP